MRFAFVAVLFAACVPSELVSRAQTRLGTSFKHTHLALHDQIAGDDIYIFCRDEHTHVGGARTYDGACVTYVCPLGRACRE